MQDKSTVRDERARYEFSTGTLAGAETWWSTMTEYQREFGQFTSDRLAKDAEAASPELSRLGRCPRNPKPLDG